MQRERGAVEALQLQSAPLDRGLPARARFRLLQQPIEIQVGRRGLAAGGDLQRLDAQLSSQVERLLEAEVADRVRVQADLHAPRLRQIKAAPVEPACGAFENTPRTEYRCMLLWALSGVY